MFDPDREQSTDSIVTDLRAKLSALGVECDVVDSRLWFRESFPRCGSLDSWAVETVSGRDYGTRRLVFDGFVVCDTPLNHAGTGVARLAFNEQRPVMLYQGPEAPLVFVTEMSQLGG